MSERHDESAHLNAEGGWRTTAELSAVLGRFDGTPQQFIRQLLDVQCKSAPAEAGAVLVLAAEGAAAFVIV